MKEIFGNLWDFIEIPNHRICITTNGFVKSNGEAVMGRGCALEAKYRFPQIPRLLGESITKNGNLVNLIYLPDFPNIGLVTFPVKHHWKDKASLELIKNSAISLEKLAFLFRHLTFILPRPGCGNGQLTWEVVKPIIEFLPDNIKVITNQS